MPTVTRAPPGTLTPASQRRVGLDVGLFFAFTRKRRPWRFV